MNVDDNMKAGPIDTTFVIGRIGYEIGTQDSFDLLGSGETLREYALRKLAEQKKLDDAA